MLLSRLDQALISRVLSKGVVIVPGSAFGKNAPDYARLSYAAPRKTLEEAIQRIQAAL